MTWPEVAARSFMGAAVALAVLVALVWCLMRSPDYTPSYRMTDKPATHEP